MYCVLQASIQCCMVFSFDDDALFRYFLDWLWIVDAFLWCNLHQLESRDFSIHNLLPPVSER